MSDEADLLSGKELPHYHNIVLGEWLKLTNYRTIMTLQMAMFTPKSEGYHLSNFLICLQPRIAIDVETKDPDIKGRVQVGPQATERL